MIDAAPATRLAEWASQLHADEIPGPVRRRAGEIFLDAVASAIAGRHGDETAQVESVARTLGGDGNATAIASQPLSVPGACLLNGYQVTAVTVCDVYRPNLCHVTPQVLPPALAVAEDLRSSGRDLLTAFAVGLEVTVRVGLGIRYAAFRDRGWHSPGVIGPFGGAAAAGRLIGLDPVRMRAAFGLAGSQAAGTFAHWGTPTIKFHQARGALSGYLAAALAAERFPASDEIFMHPDGGLFTTYSDGGDPGAMLRGLGEHWELERISLRLWPTASSIQGVVTAVFDLIEGHDLVPDEIVELQIALSDTVYRLHGEMSWEDRFRALLSTRYAAAVVLHDRRCWLEQFTPERIADAAVDGFARERISVSADASVPTNGARVEAILHDGRTVCVERSVPRGDAEDPLTLEELIGKLRDAARGVLFDAATERALGALTTMDDLADARELTGALRPPVVAA